MLLAIETSSLVSSVALLHDDTLRAELTIQARLTHSEQLMPHIADMLDKASVKKSQIDGVAVAVGPGSFTGLRIGLATAKGLSFAWNVPIVGVTTPVSLAWNFVGVSDRICTLIDAQKGNVYAGVYRWDRTTLTTEKEIYIAPRTEVLETLEREGQPVVFCGDGSLKGRAAIEGRSPLFRMAPPTMVIPRAGSVALAANVRFAAGDYDDCMTLTPSYLRRSEAEVLWEKRHGGAPCR
ncbi:MAG: tRNA (adenosine(37)-N6)-threonylcarbamoyltransferase complex dimerization subunit type 1 TsaB [Megasphaera sp.]|jgi:tRNA threonylcarbamoyladenosine biosynthesis protein TsaB|uniref:tRNA (adenosine(37)-N6)-threonylcarbamoyltransferase complex dimerization subunit type 1 TsaB n=1 Tax=Megasphaera sp. TaxID=2023260 RepID=UPI0025BBD6F4|nr:tRNA (adenosine(37)-N6)-threonylcarbamoyltransferase complex dimerization subunit type 1 TsaB [Megasphaera sp.]MCF0153570.1 tRNA (adenosine(37)-N6)-threonylcarbamoyltransferase complex dimerization subunit type 1 TsaB [Megasphaera sp.]MCI7599782.1 tRNA (adenosine(37)-N6)-threonylcarbamoyltransferase complex dimerization subunit type 1 TsaB [Megasphaera sp.]